MSVSHWRRELARDIISQVDLCVVGAGITGLTAADAGTRLGRSVAVVERGSIGVGASTRNAGFLMRGAAESYAAATDALGRDRAKELWQQTEANLRLLIDQYQIDTLPTFRRVPSVLVATSDREAELLQRSHSLLAEDGFESAVLTSGSDSLWTTLKPAVALENPNDASINPAELIARIAESVRVRTPIFENAEVFGIDDAAGGVVRVQTSRGVIEAARVLVCTNAYAGSLLRSLAGRVEPNRGQMLAIRAEGATLDASYYLNFGGEYIRQTHDGTIVVGGCRKRFEAEEQTASNEPTAEVQAELERLAEQALGVRGEIVARWAGTMGFTSDGLPITAPVEVDAIEPGRVWYCGGFTGHGMSLAATTACRIVEQCLVC